MGTRFETAALGLFLGPILCLAGACAPVGGRAAGKADPGSAPAVEAAVKDLCDLGFPGAGVDLAAAVLYGRLAPEEAVRLARTLESRAGPGTGAGLLARLYPGDPPPPVKEARLRSLIEAWNWDAASPLLEGKLEGKEAEPFRAAFLRERRFRETFRRRRHTLAWRIAGWRGEDRGDRLFLEVPPGASGAGDPALLECSTTAGWNGRSFRVEAVLRIVPSGGRTGPFFFGLSAGRGEDDPPAARLGLFHREGCTSFHRERPVGGSMEGRAWTGWWPPGRRLRVIVEYLSMDRESPRTSSTPRGGRLRGWVDDLDRGVRLFTLAQEAPPSFPGGPARVGFPPLRPGAPPPEGSGLSVEEFRFEN